MKSIYSITAGLLQGVASTHGSEKMQVNPRKTLFRFSFVLLFFLTFGVAEMSAQVSIPFEWTVSSGKSSLPSGVTHSGLGGDYAAANAPYYLKFDSQGDYIQIYTDDAVSKVTFRVKMLGGSTTSKFKVQSCSTASGTYSDIQEFTCSGSTGDEKSFTTNSIITSSHRYFRIIKSEHGSNVGFGYLKMDPCAAINVTDVSAVILPAGSTTVSSNDWKNVGAPTAYGAENVYAIGSGGYCVNLTQAGDFGGSNGLQLKANEGILEIEGITSTSGIDVELLCSGTNGLKVELTGATTLTGQTGTVSISTTSKSADLKISKTSSGAGYIKYIQISPKASSCSNTVTFADNSPTNGTVTFSPTSLETCSETASDRQATMTITPSTGYTLTSFSYSSGGVSDISPNSNSESPSLTENSSDAQEITLKFDQNDAGTCTANATFSEMVVTSWSWTMHDGGGAIPDPLNLYVGQSAQFDVAYTPSGVLSGHKTYTRAKVDTYINWSGSLQSGYSTIVGKASTGDNTTTVTFTHEEDFSENVKTVNVKVLPLPLVHFVDIVHGEEFADVVATIEANALSATKKTPTHEDFTGSTYNTCEEVHIHLMGWILKDWAEEHPDATHSEIVGAGASNFFATNADINVSTYNGKTFYAVWAKEVPAE